MSTALKQVVVVSILILVLVTVLFAFYSSEGLANKVAKFVSDWALDTFRIFGFDTDNIEPEVEKKAKEDFTKFYDAFSKEGTECMTLTNIPHNKYTIEILDIDGLYMRLVDEDGKLIANMPEEGGSGIDYTPCIIAGEESKNFYDCYIMKPSNCGGAMAKTGTEIKVVDGNLFVDGNKYDIKVSGISQQPIYVDKDKRCFIPENGWFGGGYNEDGLDNDYIVRIAQSQTKLLSCGAMAKCEQNKIKECTQYDAAICKDDPCNVPGQCRNYTKITSVGSDTYMSEHLCVKFEETFNCDDYNTKEPLEDCTKASSCTLMIHEGSLECINNAWTSRAVKCSDYTNTRDCRQSNLNCEWQGVNTGTCRSICQSGFSCTDYKNENACETDPCNVQNQCKWETSCVPDMSR